MRREQQVLGCEDKNKGPTTSQFEVKEFSCINNVIDKRISEKLSKFL